MSDTTKRGRYATPEGSATWEYIAAACCALLLFCVGCVMSWNSPSLIILSGPDSPIPLTTSDASTLAFVVPIGGLIAQPLAMVLNRFGRKMCLCAASVSMIVGFGLITAARGTSVLFLARFVSGIATSLSLCFVPIYMGEISSARLRGSLGIFSATMMNVGVIFTVILVPSVSIRVAACVYSIIAAVSTLCICLIPESPYFLTMIGKLEEAEGVLEKLRGKTDVTTDLDLVKETVHGKRKSAEVIGSKDEGEQGTPKKVNTLMLLFTVLGNRKAFVINLAFVLTIQLGGYSIIMTYGHLIFDAMESGMSGHLCMTVSAFLKMFCNVLAGFIIDKSGRRPLLFVCGVMTGTCLLIIGIYFYLKDFTEFDVTPYKLLAPYTMLAMVIAVNIGVVPVALVVQSEILHTDVKTLANCVIGICSGVMISIGVKGYLVLAVAWNLGHGVPLLIASVLTMIGVFLILALLPETKGKTLLEIQKDLNA